MELTIRMPVSADVLGRWMESNNVHVGISCQLARFHVTVTWRRPISYSDRFGSHHEVRELSRTNSNLEEALRKAMTAAEAIIDGKEPTT